MCSMKKAKLLSPQKGYDQYAVYYDQKTAYLDSFEQNKLLPFLGNRNNKKILEVGAGTGRLSSRLAEYGALVTAFDISPEILKVLHKKNKNIATVIGDAESLPFPNNTFDIVTAAFLIVHLKELKYFFNEAYRVLKPSGLLALTNINQKRPPELKAGREKIIIESYYHRPEKIIKELKSLSFSIIKNTFIKDKDVWINQIVIAAK